ncbi:MAG: T9SS type A sorting domain-containing protein [Bacteroidia bacterium]|nr:T9SS type A sorting domain-containing protein [Bacteroidia bacterium]
MNKKLTLVSVFALVAIFNITQVASYSTGPNAGYTSAPGESNCTSCHSGTPVNPVNGGSVAITITGNPASYTPGQTYEVNVTVAFTGRSRFGFALSAKKTGGIAAGTLATNGNTNVRLGSGNSYMTHTSNGTLGNTDSKVFKFNWVAPVTNAGTVTFYASGMAANGTGGDGGDFVYTTNLNFPSSGTTSLFEPKSLNSFNIYPNPATETLQVQLAVKEDTKAVFSIIDLNGKDIQILSNQILTKGANTPTFNIGNYNLKGIYLLKIELGDDVQFKKICIE